MISIYYVDTIAVIVIQISYISVDIYSTYKLLKGIIATKWAC